MSEYRLTITYKFEAVDDMDARNKAKEIKTDENCEVKLQKIFKDKPPGKINI